MPLPFTCTVVSPAPMMQAGGGRWVIVCADGIRESPRRVARLADDRMVDHVHMEATRSRGLHRSFDGRHVVRR